MQKDFYNMIDQLEKEGKFQTSYLWYAKKVIPSPVISYDAISRVISVCNNDDSGVSKPRYFSYGSLAYIMLHHSFNSSSLVLSWDYFGIRYTIFVVASLTYVDRHRRQRFTHSNSCWPNHSPTSVAHDDNRWHSWGMILDTIQ
jgi:hypothetical protein